MSTEEREWQGEKWEHQAWDTDASFESFACYRDLPPRQRSFAEVARRTGLADSRQLSRWKVKYCWGERVRAWDSEVDRQALALCASFKAEQYRSQIRMQDALDVQVLDAIKKMKVDLLTPSQLLAFMEFQTTARLRVFGPLVAQTPDEQAQTNTQNDGRVSYRVVTPDPIKK